MQVKGLYSLCQNVVVSPSIALAPSLPAWAQSTVIPEIVAGTVVVGIALVVVVVVVVVVLVVVVVVVGTGVVVVVVVLDVVVVVVWVVVVVEVAEQLGAAPTPLE